jgi:hypothetical protein
MPGGIRKNGNGKKELGNAIRGHRDAVSDAIKTGDMEKVREANNIGFKEEMREVKEYSRM